MYNLDKIKGCMFGQAIGDALGLGSEFMTREEVNKYYPNGLTQYDQIIQDYHRCRWHKGDWTDDTDMWLCIANAIISENFNLNYTTIAQNFKKWHNGEHLGCGGHTNKVLSMEDYVEKAFECAILWWEVSRRRAAANGALMRTSIIGLLPDYKPEIAESVCKLTHADPRCVGSCVILCNLINALTYSKPLPSVEEICEIAENYDERIVEYIRIAYSSSLDSVVIDDHSMGYTLNTLFVALWAYYHAESFESGLLDVVNAGGDADTNAAVACSLLGAKFGFESIPLYYVDGLYRKNELDNVYNSFVEMIIVSN